MVPERLSLLVTKMMAVPGKASKKDGTAFFSFAQAIKPMKNKTSWTECLRVVLRLIYVDPLIEVILHENDKKEWRYPTELYYKSTA